MANFGDFVKSELVKELAGVEHCGITTDAWTSRTQQSFIGVTVHWVDKTEWTYHCRTISCEPMEGRHTAEELAKHLAKIINQMIPENTYIAAVATDTTAVMPNMVHDHLHAEWIPCAGHLLQLAILDVVGKGKIAAFTQGFEFC